MQEKQVNRLFPAFLKLESLGVLIVGAGKVGLEKLQAVFLNSPAAEVHVVAREISEGVRTLAADKASVHLSEKQFEEADLGTARVVLIAIDDPQESARIAGMARAAGRLVNVADKPELCDFYMGSVVRKGNLKVAISTNGLSPTVAKRLREMLEEVFPDEIDEVLERMQEIRRRMGRDFGNKVRELNEITKGLVGQNQGSL